MGETGNLISVVLSVVSTVTIGAQQKLKWAETAEKFSNAAKAYALLCASAFFKMKESDVTNTLEDERIKEFMKYIENVKSIETSNISDCPLPPAFIVNKYNKKCDKESSVSGFVADSIPAKDFY